MVSPRWINNGKPGYREVWGRCLISTDLVELLQTVFAEKSVRTDEDALQVYRSDKSYLSTGLPKAVVFPESAEQLQQLVLLAQQHNFALLPSGGRTGLSGAACATGGEVVVSFEKMSQVLWLDPSARVLTVQAGVPVEVVQITAAEHQLYYPIDLASKGSCQIGGTIATNAGGVHVLGHGMTRQQVLGLQVVTGKGEILQLGHGLEKDNTGYDLMQLFIGSEGTLGFITAATLKLSSPPANIESFLLAANDIEEVQQLFKRCCEASQARAFEFFSAKSLEAVLARHQLDAPFSAGSGYYFLMEFESVSAPVLLELQELLSGAIQAGQLLDVLHAQNLKQQQQFWFYRENISDSTSVQRPCKYDVTVQSSNMSAFLQVLENKLKAALPESVLYSFGHLADGNVHLNIVASQGEPHQRNAHEVCDAIVYPLVDEFSGSISAEHGIGLLKKQALQASKPAAELAIMREIKKVFDPFLIMNPGKIFD